MRCTQGSDHTTSSRRCACVLYSILPTVPLYVTVLRGGIPRRVALRPWAAGVTGAAWSSVFNAVFPSLMLSLSLSLFLALSFLALSLSDSPCLRCVHNLRATYTLLIHV